MNTSKVRVSVVGGAGYTGGELVRILSSHPGVELTAITSSTYAGQPIRNAFSGSTVNLTFEKFDSKSISAKSDIVFFAQDNGFAMQHAGAFLTAGKKVIDLAADFRLRNPKLYPAWYKLDHSSPELLESAVYGLPELNRAKIKGAKLIANPGCYPTASTLALAPLLKEKLIDPSSIIIDAVSGVSGAGRAKFSLDYHFAEVNESVRAYGVAGTHRHTPEIEQNLSEVAGAEIKLTFTPHLVPISRGILATCYAQAKRTIKPSELVERYRDFYRNERFVVVFDNGKLPATKGTYATNECHLGLAFDERTERVIVIGAIDNLVKGAAGQAVQNLNLISGMPEELGLTTSGVWP